MYRYCHCCEIKGDFLFVGFAFANLEVVHRIYNVHVNRTYSWPFLTMIGLRFEAIV